MFSSKPAEDQVTHQGWNIRPHRVADADALVDALSITDAVPDDHSDADSMKSVAIRRMRDALA